MSLLARRYLDRKTKEHFKKLARTGKFPSHITEKGPKIPEFDEASGQKRIIYLQDWYADSKSASELLNEKILELCHTAAETSQYIKLVNHHIDKQKLRIDDLKEVQKTFESQIRFLESDKDAQKRKPSTKID